MESVATENPAASQGNLHHPCRDKVNFNNICIHIAHRLEVFKFFPHIHIGVSCCDASCPFCHSLNRLCLSKLSYLQVKLASLTFRPHSLSSLVIHKYKVYLPLWLQQGAAEAIFHTKHLRFIWKLSFQYFCELNKHNIDERSVQVLFLLVLIRG